MSRERERFDEIGKKIKRDIDAASSFQLGIISRSRSGHNNINNNDNNILNTITPCAACKLLRRRCAQECPFSPYFSPHEPHKFASVHKVFGASNVSKLLMEVPEKQRADAANSLVYEANVRLRDPVYGCMGAISALQHQVQSLQAELNAVRAEILRYKYISQTTHQAPPDDQHNNNNNNNIIIPPSSTHHHHHLANLFSINTGADHVPASVAPPPPPPPPPPAPSSSNSSMYTPPPVASTSTTDYTTINTNDNHVSSYFG